MFYIELGSGFGTPICFGDCIGYVQPTLAPDFTSWIASLAHGFRTYPVPLLFSMFGSYDFEAAVRILQFQTVFYFIAWLAFSAAVASRVSGFLVRRIVFLCAMSFMLSRVPLALNQYVQSDSLSLSLQLLMLAVLVRIDGLATAFASQRPGVRYGSLVAFLVLVALAVPARDTNGLFLAVAFAFAPWLAPAGFRRQAAIAMGIVWIATVLTLAGASGSERAQFNMRNIIAARVLPDPQVRAFFVARGMPDDAGVQAIAKRLADDWRYDPRGAGPADVRPGGALLEAHGALQQHGPMREFMPKARGVWLSFLITHPSVALEALVDQRTALFGQDPPLFSTARVRALTPLCESGCNASVVAPRQAPSFLDAFGGLPLIALGLVAFGFRASRATRTAARSALCSVFDAPTLFAIALILAGGVCAWGASLGDYWETTEMYRHVWAGSFFFNLGFALLVLGAVETLANERRRLNPAATTETA